MKLDQVLGSFPATWAHLRASRRPHDSRPFIKYRICHWICHHQQICYTGMITIIIHNVHCMYSTCLIICWGISVASWNIFCTLGFFWLANKPGDMVLHVFAKYIIKICSKGHIERKYLMKSYLLLLKSRTNFKI